MSKIRRLYVAQHHIFAGVTSWLHRRQDRICGRWILLVEDSLNVSPAWNPHSDFARNREVSSFVISRMKVGLCSRIGLRPRITKSARKLAGGDSCVSGGHHDAIRQKICAEIREGSRLPDQGPRAVENVLRLSRRSLGPFENDKSDRMYVRDGKASRDPRERCGVARYCSAHGFQAGDGRRGVDRSHRTPPMSSRVRHAFTLRAP